MKVGSLESFAFSVKVLLAFAENRCVEASACLAISSQLPPSGAFLRETLNVEVVPVSDV